MKTYDKWINESYGAAKDAGKFKVELETEGRPGDIPRMNRSAHMYNFRRGVKFYKQGKPAKRTLKKAPDLKFRDSNTITGSGVI